MTAIKTVLLADDDPIFRLKASEHLKRNYGLKVTEAENGRDAIAAFKSARMSFDLVMTDLAMPDMDGIELLHSLAALGYDKPVVLVSGERPLTIKMASILAQQNGLEILALLSKPVTSATLDSIFTGHRRRFEVA